MNTHCVIHGFGISLPSRTLTNDDLSRLVETNDEWIRTRTGIQERRMLAEDESPVELACKAAQEALDAAGIKAESVTHVLVATCTPEYLCPSTASRVAGALGCQTSVMAFDFNAACTGFVYGLSLAQSLTAHSQDALVLLVCVEALTRRINWQDRSTAVLFGDGACALVLSGKQSQPHIQGQPAGIVKDVSCHSDGTLWELIRMGGGTKQAYAVGDVLDEDFFLHMQGREVFKHAVRNLTTVCQDVVTRNGYSMDDIDLFVPHQANLRIIEAVGQRLSLPEHKVFTNVQQYGNTSSVSVPLALAEARHAHPEASLVLVAAVGAGFTWGAALLEFVQ